MRSTFLFFLSILVLGRVYAQNVAINTTGVVADNSSILDVNSNNKGMLIPRITLTGSTDMTTVTTPAVSLLIYNTATVSDVIPGFYYWNGASWTRLMTVAGSNNNWSISGNSGTVDGTHFIGTTDNVPVNFKMSNEKAGRIDYGNTFFGYRSGENNGSSLYNCGFGSLALFSNSTGESNTAVGINALFANLSGDYNVAIGNEALSTNITGGRATAIGWGAMQNANNQLVPYHSFSVAVGFEALRGSLVPSFNTGINNTVIGYQGLLSNSSGSFNTAVGCQTLFSNTAGNNNTANGYGALWSNINGSSNTACGTLTLFNNTIGWGNTAIGSVAMNTNINGIRNTSCGVTSLHDNISGNDNTANGFEALRSNVTGNNNTALGSMANVASGSLLNTTVIGYSAVVHSSNTIQLGNTNIAAVYSSGNNINRNPSLSAINATGTATAAQIVSGYITTTSPAPVTITLPTAAQIATQIAGGVVQGTSLFFTVDNSAGANTVTIAPGTGITTTTAAILGGSSLVITPLNSIGYFRLVFTSPTTAKIFRIH